MNDPGRLFCISRGLLSASALTLALACASACTPKDSPPAVGLTDPDATDPGVDACTNPIPFEAPEGATEITYQQWVDGLPGRYRLEHVSLYFEGDNDGHRAAISATADVDWTQPSKSRYSQRILCREVPDGKLLSLSPSFPQLISRDSGSYDGELKFVFQATRDHFDADVSWLKHSGVLSNVIERFLEAPAESAEYRLYSLTDDQFEVRMRYLGFLDASGNRSNGYRSIIYSRLNP